MAIEELQLIYVCNGEGVWDNFDPEGSKFIVEAECWHDGQGFSPLYACPSLEAWQAFKVKSEVSDMDMTFRLREQTTGKIVDIIR